MSITKSKKSEIIEQFKKSEADTGSADVQIAVLTERIRNLTEHMKEHKKDFHSRYGLLKMVSRRRRLLDYLKSVDEKRYLDLIATLNLRR